MKITKKSIEKDFADVMCYYTGGGIYIYSAKYRGIYLFGTLDQYIYPVPGRAELYGHGNGFDALIECGLGDEIARFPYDSEYDVPKKICDEFGK